MGITTEDTTIATDPAPEAVTLDEFCQILSKSDRRVELIGGFHSDEVRAGKAKDLEANYLVRFQAFATKPV